MTAADTLITEFKLKDRFTADFKGLLAILKAGLTAIASATAAIAGVGVAAGTAILKPAADLESLKNALKAVEGSADGATKAFGRLRNLAKAPGLGFRESIEGYIQLRNADLDPKLSEAIIKEIANANARGGGDRESFSRALLAISQIAGTEFLQGDELNQLQEARIPARKIVKDAFGTANTEDLKKNGVTSKEIIGAIVQQLSKLERVSGSTGTAWENLVDAFQMVKAALGTPLLPAAVKLIEKLSEALERIEASGALARIGTGFAKMFDGDWMSSSLIQALTWLLGAMDVLPQKVKENWDKISAAFKESWEWAKKLIGILVAAFTASSLVRAFIAVVEIYGAWLKVTKAMATAQVIHTAALGLTAVAIAAIGAGLATYLFLDNMGDIGKMVGDATGFNGVMDEVAASQKKFNNLADGKTEDGHFILKPGEKDEPLGQDSKKPDTRQAQLEEEQTRKLREIASNTRDSLQLERRIMGGGATGAEAFSAVRIDAALGGRRGRSAVERAVLDLVSAIEKSALEKAAGLISGRAAPTERR